jgi:hypothetical protein
MPIPFCFELPEIPDPLSIPMFGFDVQGVDLLDQLQPMLAPLMPFFNIIDTIVALFNCVKAIPDSLGPPPDPTAIAACIPELSKALSKLLAMNPMMVLPGMLKGICGVIIQTLSEARNEYGALASQLEYIASAIDRASNLNDSGLMAVIACAQGNAEQQSANIAKALASLGRLIGIINMLFAIIGLPEVPLLDGLVGVPLSEIIAPLDALIEVFVVVRNSIPVP